jgi:hypothetical protein
MFRCLFRFIVLVALAIVVLIFLAPGFFEQIGSSLLNAVNNSSVGGLAQFIPGNPNNQNSHLQISASGLTASSQYDITLDDASCGGAPSIDLGTVVTDSSGNIDQALSVGTLDTGQTWYIDLHQGSNASGNILACGRLIISSNILEPESTPFIVLNPPSGGQVSTPAVPGATPTPAATSETGFPNTGVRPGDPNHYDNNVYPRKF